MTKVILFCDDSPQQRRNYGRAAKLLGHRSIIADDAARAWELIQEGERFDLIFSDNDIPEMTGIEFLKLEMARESSSHTEMRRKTMEPYTQISTWEERRAPEGKYRVMLNDRGEDPALYYVGDFDTAEEAFVVAESLDKRDQNGIVQGRVKRWVLYPDFDGHQLHTRESLLKYFGRPRLSEVTGSVLERALTDADIDAIEKKQTERIPGWQPGHRLVVFWRDIADATGAVARPGDLGY